MQRSLGTLVFLIPKYQMNSNGGHPTGAPNTGDVSKNRQQALTLIVAITSPRRLSFIADLPFADHLGFPAVLCIAGRS